MSFIPLQKRITHVWGVLVRTQRSEWKYWLMLKSWKRFLFIVVGFLFGIGKLKDGKYTIYFASFDQYNYKYKGIAAGAH